MPAKGLLLSRLHQRIPGIQLSEYDGRNLFRKRGALTAENRNLVAMPGKQLGMLANNCFDAANYGPRTVM
jgi:hypothetical protein